MQDFVLPAEHGSEAVNNRRGSILQTSEPISAPATGMQQISHLAVRDGQYTVPVANASQSEPPEGHRLWVVSCGS